MSIYDNDGFDPDAYRKASKALYIIFILLILLANGLLIVKNALKWDFWYKPKTLTILSLAIGDILLALFPMVVKTKILFQDYDYLTCSLRKSFSVYFPYLITFVYSIGLMVLGFEIIQSHNNSLVNKNTQIIYSLAYSSLPWILGLIIVLPLGMTNYDDDTCRGSQTIGQLRALFIIGIMLPACGAVITSIFVRHRTSQTVTIPAQGLVVSTSQTTAFSSLTSSPEGVIAVNHGQPLRNVPPPATQGQSPYYPQQPQVQASTSQTDAVITPATVSSTTTPKVKRLLAISVVNFFLVVPFAIFVLSYYLSGDFKLMPSILFTVIEDFVLWLNILRSVITPLMMYRYSDK